REGMRLLWPEPRVSTKESASFVNRFRSPSDLTCESDAPLC
ncbi:MAG: hypothetical protein ACI91B_003468, partial [Planctomycetota bacterium]